MVKRIAVKLKLSINNYVQGQCVLATVHFRYVQKKLWSEIGKLVLGSNYLCFLHRIFCFVIISCLRCFRPKYPL